MAFADELRAYLESIDRSSQRSPVKHRHVDDAELKKHFLRRLRDCDGVASPGTIAQWHEHWSPELPGFARYIEQLPFHDAPVDVAAAQAFAQRALDLAVGLIDLRADRSIVDELELKRIANGFGRRRRAMETYGLENHLLSATGARDYRRLTAVARVFLRLRGKDAVRWLLTMEVLQNTGRFDPWRIGYALLTEAIADGGIRRAFDDDGDVGFGFALESLERGVELGVLSSWAGPDHDGEPVTVGHGVVSAMREVVDAVAEPGPWHSAIRALLEDERAAVFPTASQTASASDATVEQGRMFAHEARNALLPARRHLDVLGTAVPAEKPRIDAVRRGIVRILDFVEQIIVTGELVTEPAVECDVADVIADAVAECEDRERVQVSAGPTTRVRAPRSRFELTLINLIRNALAATAPTGQVRVRWRRDAGLLNIDVDDDGPGVPAEDRVRIFDDGYTTRPGGSGFGLAFVKKAVETALRGKVWCERSDLGGARFSIEIAVEPTP